MKLAYLILAHKNLEQIKRMISRLNTENCFFIIHLDKRIPRERYESFKNSFSQKNVEFIEKRIKVQWAGFSMVQAIIKLINYLYESGKDYDQVIYISGQDYPIKTNEYIQNFLKENKGNLFISGSLMPYKSWEGGGMSRFEKWHFRKGGKFGKYYFFPKNNWIKRKFIRGYEPYGGSSWWSCPKEMVDYLYDFLKKNKKFIRYFIFVNNSDEIFFHTIFLNNPKIKKKQINSELVYVDWTDPKEIPKILDINDFEKLKNSEKLFARKIDMYHDLELLNKIDKELLNIY